MAGDHKSGGPFGGPLANFAGFALAAVLLLIVMAKMGFYDSPGGSQLVTGERPKWDNKACLRDAAYRIRTLDPTTTDEDLSGQVARECARLKSEFYGW